MPNNDYESMKSLAVQLKERYTVYLELSGTVSHEKYKDLFIIPVREERNSVIRILEEMNSLEDAIMRKQKLNRDNPFG